MQMASELWKFAPTFNRSRSNELRQIADFNDVVSLLTRSVSAIHVSACPGRDAELKSCVQPVFTLSVSEGAFDAFFNSPVGYRACYLRGANAGLSANLALIETLLDRLLDKAALAGVLELEAIDVRTSLLATSCKVWVDEDDFPFQNLTEDLAIDAWVHAAASGVEKASWGLCAPKGTRIQVKGALLDPCGNEIVPGKKILRRHEIQRYGFS
jgi:hypothetical protein